MRIATLLAVTLLVTPSLLGGQAVTPPTMPKVGDDAPDFALVGSSMGGIEAKPVKLSDYRGKTVVIAFFPRQRTSGCTVQMTHYRDAYDSIFGGGKSATLFAVSIDSAAAQQSWAAEAKFPFTFLSDVNGVAGQLYGTQSAPGRTERRVVFVIAPNGKIAAVMNPFREVDATSYEDLSKAIQAAKTLK